MGDNARTRRGTIEQSNGSPDTPKSPTPSSSLQPLGLAEVVDSGCPAIVRAALGRFRRRVLIWAAWAIVGGGVAYGLFLFFAWPGSGQPTAVRFASEPSGVGVGSIIEEGPVHVLVLEAKLLEHEVGVRLLVTAERLEPDERVVTGLTSGVVEVFHPERGGTGPSDHPPAPPGIDLLTEIARDKVEILVTFEPGTERLAFDVGAAASPPAATNGPPGQLPPPPAGIVFGGPDQGIRPLATVRLDMPKIGIPRSIWR